MKIRKLLLTGALLYGSVAGFAQTTALFTVNDQAVSLQSPLQCFTNNPLMFQDQSQGGVTNVTITIMDATFTTVLFTTGSLPVNNNAGEINLYDATQLPKGTTGIFGIVETTSTGPNDPSPSTYSGLITLDPPTTNPANASFTINNKAVSMQSATDFNGPQSLELEYTGSGDVATYCVDVMDPSMENVIYTTGYIAGSVPARLTVPSLNAQTTGSYVVRLTASPSGFADPAESSYTGLINVNPAIPPCNAIQPSFTIDNTPVSLQNTTQFFNCRSLFLYNTTTAPIASYKVSIATPDQSEVLYTTDYMLGDFQQLDLSDLCANTMGKCSSMSNTTGGTFAVSLWASPVANFNNVCANTYTGLVSISPAINAATANFITTTVDASGNQVVYTSPSTSAATPDDVGRLSTDLKFLRGVNSQVYVSSYTVTLEQWNGTGWNPVSWTETFSNGNNFTTPTEMPLSALGGNGFFADPLNAPDWSTWRVAATLYNPCGNFTVSQVVRINPSMQ